ncbi:ABC transporter permease [Rhodanobacter hydrolyticus]|uniref:ABC transporter permease n=1 Tax=Rhodanobacter hydrolyticus TaxID=2250595 RepID=A0ABW8J9I1_9GAMM
MFGHYLDLALRSLRRNKLLTALMVLAIGLGIGACITTLTVLHLLSGDPMPGKSGQLFYPQIMPDTRSKTEPEGEYTYIDATNLLREHRADRQAIVVSAKLKVFGRPGTRPMSLSTVATTADFFPMFGVPFHYGAGWRSADDDARARVAVISQALNDKLFGGADSVGRSIRLDKWDFRIVGVLKHWRPIPRFYDLYGQGGFASDDGVFIPFATSRDLAELGIQGNSLDCWGQLTDQVHLESQPCVWLQYWVELDTPSKAAAYREYLVHYSEQQKALGRFQFKGKPLTALRGLMDWLSYNQVVPSDVRLQTWMAFGFLLVCLINTVGLLLSKFLRRSGEIGVRRALGASRGTVFAQLLTEAGLIGVAGGMLGLLLALAGLWAVRCSPTDYATLAHLDPDMFLITFVLAILASLLAGLLPAWRACLVPPALQLKSH